jgi:hypothetical protein
MLVVLFALGDLKIESLGGGTTPTVDVTVVDYHFSSSDGGLVCWSNYSGPGNSGASGETLLSGDALPCNPNSTETSTSTAETVTAVTPGFSIVKMNAPLTVSPGQTGYLYVDVRTTSVGFTGAPTLDVSVEAS